MKRIWVFLLLGSTALADVPVPPAASQTEVNAGVIHSKYVAPDTLHGYTGGPVYAITSNTNVILLFNDSSAPNVPAQGMCNDLLCGGTNTYIVDTSTILLADQRFFRRSGSPYAVVLNQNQATNQLAGWNYLDTDIHFGDPDLFSNYMYLPFENFCSDVDPTNGWINTYIGILNCHGPAGVIGQSLYKAFSVSNYQAEISSIAIDPSFSNGIALFASNWGAKHTTSQIYRYSLDATMTNLTFVNYMTLSQSLPYIQGMVCYNGLLYVMCDGNNTVYAVNPSNGNVVASIAMNVPVVGGSEFEGLDIYPTATGPLLAVDIVTTPATSQNGVNCFNFFGNPTVTSDQIVTGDLIGNLSLTTGKIGPDQLPYPLYLTGDPNLGVVDFHGVRFLYASYFLGNGLYLTDLNASSLTSGTVPLAQLTAGVITNNSTISNLDFFASGVLISNAATRQSILFNSGNFTLADPVNNNANISCPALFVGANTLQSSGIFLKSTANMGWTPNTDSSVARDAYFARNSTGTVDVHTNLNILGSITVGSGLIGRTNTWSGYVTSSLSADTNITVYRIEWQTNGNGGVDIGPVGMRSNTDGTISYRGPNNLWIFGATP